jgi:hypothetical protein
VVCGFFSVAGYGPAWLRSVESKRAPLLGLADVEPQRTASPLVGPAGVRHGRVDGRGARLKRALVMVLYIYSLSPLLQECMSIHCKHVRGER